MATLKTDPPLLEDIDDPYVDPWSVFLGAKWFKGRPTEEGVYYTGTLEGHVVGFRAFRKCKGELVDTLRRHGEPGWQGWFFGPIPYLPPKAVPDEEST